MTRSEDGSDGQREEGGRILQFPRRATWTWWVKPEDVDDDEARAFTHAIVLRHTDARVAEELLPLVSDPREADGAMAALAAVAPPEAIAQIVAYRALAGRDDGVRTETALEALALDPENLDARVLLTVIREPGREARRIALDLAISDARRRPVVDAGIDALEPVFVRTRDASLARALTARSRVHLSLERSGDALRDADEAAALDPIAAAPRLAAAVVHLHDGDGGRARRALDGLEGEDVDGVVLWALVLAWFLEHEPERARDHLALARRAAPTSEAHFVATASGALETTFEANGVGADDHGLDGHDDGRDPRRTLGPAWRLHAAACAWLLDQGEPIEDALEDAFRFDEPLAAGPDGRPDPDLAEAYGEALVRRFLVSDEARAHLGRGGSTALVQWALLDSLANLDKTPAAWTARDLDELLIGQAPDHLDLLVEDARSGLEAMNQFLRFLGRAFGFDGARELEAHLDGTFAARFEAACRGERT